LLQDVARGQILWVDEAGFLSSRQMPWLVQFADQNGWRLILSGDTRQHHAVERGDALRVLEDAGVVTQASLSKIVRQQIEPLREAMTDLSQGRTKDGFDKLDIYGAVHEFEDKAERLAAIAEIHLSARARGEPVMTDPEWFVAAIDATPAIAQNSMIKMRFCRSRRRRRAWISTKALVFMEQV
jgi:ATP-dependent exoDNAse (exonuclease V) alpha subunit